MRLIKIIQEINNYFFIGRVLRKHQNTPEWNKHKLRVGYFNVIYCIVNLPPEVFESEELYYRAFIVEQLKPVNDYLASLNLQETVTLKVDSKIDKDQGVYAYLARYIPLFRELTLGWVIKWGIIVGVLTWLEVKYSYIQTITAWIHSINWSSLF